MSDSTDQAILQFKIDDNDAISKMESLKASMIQIKQEQKDLTDAYKKGSITLEEYSEKTVQNDNIQRKAADSYKKLQQQVTGVTSSFDKLTDALKQNTGNLKIAGVSVGEVTNKLSSMVTPIGAAVVSIAALGKAYADSAVGARDLREASQEIKATYDIISNDVGNANKQGFLDVLAEKTANAIIYFKNLANAQKTSDEIAKKNDAVIALREFENLQIEQIKLDKEEADLRDTAYQNQIIRDDKANKTLEQREAAARRIVTDLEARTQKQNELDQKKIDVLRDYGITTGQINKETKKAYDEYGELNKQILSLETAISTVKAENGRKIDQAIKQEQIITEEKRKQKILEDTNAIPGKSYEDILKEEADKVNNTVENATKASQNYQDIAYEQYVQTKKNELKVAEDVAKGKEEISKKDVENTNREIEALVKKEREQEGALNKTASVLDRTSSLFKKGSEEQRALSEAGAIIHTYSAAAAALAPPPVGAGPILGPILAALTVAEGLADIAKINGAQFAEGGYTGSGHKYQPAGIVHAGEVVWNQTDVASVGGPRFADSLRPTYKGHYDGGVVTNTSTQQSDIQMSFNDTIKNMPQPVVGIKEQQYVENRVINKQTAYRI